MNKLILRGILIIASVSLLAVGSTTAYFSDIKVITGNVFSTGYWSTVLINEVYYFGDKEWIELFNPGNSTVDIKGWSMCNSNNNCGKLNPNIKTDVPAGGYVLVSQNANDIKDWRVPKETTKIYYAGGKIDFKDTGDSALLKDSQGATIDQMDYVNNSTDAMHALARIPNGQDTNNNSDFQLIIPTPGLKND
jgi:predicted ribosomally synthesized peptide with SipW-like signal peptide